MKIQDFIKKDHYYGIRKKRNTIYFKVIMIHSVCDTFNAEISVGARCIRQYEKDDIHDSVIMTESGLFVFSITQKDLDEGNVWEMSKESIIETAMNMMKYSLKEF